MTNNIYYPGLVHSNIFQNKSLSKRATLPSPLSIMALYWSAPKRSITGSPKTLRQAGICQLKSSLCLCCNDWHGWAADTELRSSGHNAGSSSSTSLAAPARAVFLSEKSLTPNVSWKPTGGGVVWFRFTNVEKKQFICTTEQQDWTLWVITPLGGRTWGKMKAAKQQSDKTAGSRRIEGSSHSKTWLNQWALWLFHTSGSLFIIFYSLCLSWQSKAAFFNASYVATKHDNINEWIWMQIFSVGKSADSISNKWQKTSYYRREWGASGTANRTTFRAPRRHPCGMLIGSRATEDVYKQPGSMNPQVASRSRKAATPAWFCFFFNLYFL